MARMVNQDFDELLGFFSNDNLNNQRRVHNVRIRISAFHKKYYAYLILIEELRASKDRAGSILHIDETQFSYLQESCSDLGQALFLVIHGCYKGAKLLIRSSIENFLKGVAFDEDVTIVTTKSVYEVIEKAEATSLFGGAKHDLHTLLHDIYAKLCQDVHTADVAHMSSISALGHSPYFDSNISEQIFDNFKRLVNVYVTLLAIKYNVFYHTIGYENKQVLNDEILRQYKKEVQNLK